MQKLTIHIPDNKLTFFIELVKNLGFKVDTESRVLTPEQTDLVNAERRKIKEDPDHFLDWGTARKTLNTD